MKRVNSLIVAVGSAEKMNMKRNPFSGDERVRMLKSYLKERDVKVKDVVAVDDGKSWSSAIDNLFERCGRFDILFTDKKRITKLVGNRVKVVGFRRTGMVSSTMIRDSIAAGDDRWKSLTGKSVASLIVKLDGVRRIRRAYGLRG